MEMNFCDVINNYIKACRKEDITDTLWQWINNQSLYLKDYSGIEENDCILIQPELRVFIERKEPISHRELRILLNKVGLSKNYKPDEDYTKDEHYIAQMYLKRFSNEREKPNPKIWQYNLEQMAQVPSETPVSIKKICFIRDLYECKDKSGNYIQRNEIEKILSEFENIISSVFDGIEEKASRTTKAKIFLDYKEQAWLKMYIILQILRHPDTINIAKTILRNSTSGNFDDDKAQYHALSYCLDTFISNDAVVDDSNIYIRLFDLFSNKCFIIGKSEKEEFFTCDRPFFFNKRRIEESGLYEIHKIIFPISSSLVLYMIQNSTTKPDYNCLVEFDAKHIEECQSAIAYSSKNWIYSKHPITPEQEMIIKKAQEAKLP